MCSAAAGHARSLRAPAPELLELVLAAETGQYLVVVLPSAVALAIVGVVGYRIRKRTGKRGD